MSTSNPSIDTTVIRPYTNHFNIRDHSGVVGFTPLTAEARSWWRHNVQEHEGWQQMGATIYVDHHQAWRIIDAIVDAFG